MGASHSTPPPLVEVNAPGGKVLVPPGTAFTVHPPSYARSKSDPYTRGPIYTPCSPPPYRGGRRGPLPRARPRPRYAGHGIDISEGSDESESTLPDMMEGMSPRGMRRQASKGYPGGMMGGGGGGMPGMGRRGGPGFFEGMDGRPRSAPEMQIGGHPGMMGGVPMGMPGSPGLGGMRGLGGGLGGMGPGGMGAMGGRPPPGMPPEYTSNPTIPRFGGGGMPGAGMNPYANHPGAASSQSSTSSPDPPQAIRRPPGRKQRHYEHIPMGAYASAEKPQRPRVEPQTSARLNRGQPLNKRVGPSGGEWIEGENPWLDACTCTTSCNCRKSHHVLYRAQSDRHTGSDSDEQDPLLTSGEIRYVLKTDLGKDCGDHSGCKKSSESDSSGKEDKSRKKKKEKKEEKKRKDQLDEFKDVILEGLDERLQGLRKDSRQQRRDTSESPTRQPLGGPGIGPNMGPSAFMMNQDMNMDPRIAHHTGMMPGGAYGTSRMPLGIADPTAAGKRPMMHPGLAAMGGGGMSGMGPAGLRAGFENDMLSEMDGMGLAMGNLYMHSGGMMNKNGMRPNYMSHRGAKAGRQYSNGGMGMDIDQMAAMYAKAMGRGGGGGRGGMMMGGGRSGGGRRAQLDSESDDFDLGPMRSGRRQHVGRDRAGRGSRRPDNLDKDTPSRRDFGGSLLGRNNNNSHNNNNDGSSQDRGKQPRVDTDDDDAY